MHPNEIMQSNMLDILFEHRNKTYGAYPLRKSYNKRLAFALVTTLLIAAIFSMLQLLHRNETRLYVHPVSIIDDPHLINVPPPQPLAPVPQQPVHVRQTIYSTPVIVSNEQQTSQPTIEDLTNSMISDEIAAGDIPPGDIVVASSANIAGAQAAAVAPQQAEDESILATAEFMPEFPGGIEALKKFLLKNIRQPDELQAGEKIVVLASFVVAKNGNIGDIKIVGSGRSDLDKEVLRVIGKMPVWKPGKQNGHEVSVYFNLPVTFIGADEE